MFSTLADPPVSTHQLLTYFRQLATDHPALADPLETLTGLIDAQPETESAQEKLARAYHDLRQSVWDSLRSLKNDADSRRLVRDSTSALWALRCILEYIAAPFAGGDAARELFAPPQPTAARHEPA